MTKVRPAGAASLADAMARVVEVRDKEELMQLLCRDYYFWNPTAENVTIEKYGLDERINWDTYLICVDGKAALFTKGYISL